MKLIALLILLISGATANAQTQKVWKKDPFAPPFAPKEEKVKAQTQEPEVEKKPLLELTAILFSNERSSAIINGSLHHTGDEVAGLKILDIQKTYVILVGKSGKSRLELKK